MQKVCNKINIILRKGEKNGGCTDKIQFGDGREWDEFCKGFYVISCEWRPISRIEERAKKGERANEWERKGEGASVKSLHSSEHNFGASITKLSPYNFMGIWSCRCVGVAKTAPCVALRKL